MLSFTTIVNLIFFSNIAIVLTDLVYKKKCIYRLVGVDFYFLNLLIITLRLAVPFQLPLSQSIGIKLIYPKIYTAIKKDFFYCYSLLDIMLFVWLVGLIYFFIKLVSSYFNIKRIISNYRLVEKIEIIKAFEKIIDEHSKVNKNIKIVESDIITSPFIFGIFRPIIVIPNMRCTDIEWYYILKHEIVHLYNNDLKIKLICEFIRTVYWWNPYMRILIENITEALELRTDIKVVNQLDDLQKIDYMECLIKIAKNRIKRNSGKQWIFEFQSNDIINRINFISEKIRGNFKVSIKNFILMSSIFIIVVFPTYIVLEPSAITKEDEINSYELNSENSYFILNSDHTYDLYLNDKKLVTVECIFDESIPIFKNREEMVCEKKEN